MDSIVTRGITGIVLVLTLAACGESGGGRGGGGGADAGPRRDAGPSGGNEDTGPGGKEEDAGEDPPDDCGSATTCADCTAMSSCGFCGASGTCHEGDGDGPTDGASCASDWNWISYECKPAMCETATTCADCTGMPTCGWCPGTGTCSEGDGDGPDVGMCEMGWAWLSSECPGAGGDAGPAM